MQVIRKLGTLNLCEWGRQNLASMSSGCGKLQDVMYDNSMLMETTKGVDGSHVKYITKDGTQAKVGDT